ncbi:hypothetical protein MMC20_006988 [Loxospora ochrophaea]|nr:hypothetical protein [Loxospora ochrophaea]
MTTGQFSTQLALSVELTKILPFGSWAAALGRTSLQLLRNINKSGSDVFAEEILAKVFSRNRVDSQFASTFRTLVASSSRIHRIPAVLEIVLDAAGPTITRALTEDAYFATVIQLSLLTFSHDIPELTQNLAKALERRSAGSDEPVDIPDHATLKGTLYACQTQTAAFRWSEYFDAVEDLLQDVVEGLPPYESRPLTPDILQALLDFFAALQAFPEHNVIQVEAITGAATIVVWAHKVLGLTVTVQSNSKAMTFGRGREQVFVNFQSHSMASSEEKSSISLLNETNDLLFKIADPNDSLPLDPSCRHSAHGYGISVLYYALEQKSPIQEFGLRIVASCLQLVQDLLVHQDTAKACRASGSLLPSTLRLLNAGSMLFGNLPFESAYFRQMQKEPCLCTSVWRDVDLPTAVSDYLGGIRSPGGKGRQLRKTMRRLALLVFAFAMVTDLSHCGNMPLDLYPKDSYDLTLFRVPTARESFHLIAKVLLGFAYNEDVTNNAALVSSWGWSVFVSSITCEDPSEARPEISIQLGVPSRNNERRGLITDTGPVNLRTGRNLRAHNYGSSTFECVATPGQTTSLQSLTTEKATRCFISITDDAFIVTKQFEIASTSAKAGGWLTSTLGFRAMQEVCWRLNRLPSCDHETRVGEQAKVPNGVWCFSGIDKPFVEKQDEETKSWLPETWTQDPEGWVHAGLVAGVPSARWFLAYHMHSWKILFPDEDEGNSESPMFLRGNDCCFQCALDITQSCRNGRVLGLIL